MHERDPQNRKPMLGTPQSIGSMLAIAARRDGSHDTAVTSRARERTGHGLRRTKHRCSDICGSRSVGMIWPLPCAQLLTGRRAGRCRCRCVCATARVRAADDAGSGYDGPGVEQTSASEGGGYDVGRAQPTGLGSRNSMMLSDAEDGERRWLGRSDHAAHRYGSRSF